MLGEVEAGLNLLDQIRNWYRTWKNPPAESVATRLIRLFHSYGVHRNQIPRFLSHGITLQDLRHDDTLLANLNESTLDAACVRFAVRHK